MTRVRRVVAVAALLAIDRTKDRKFRNYETSNALFFSRSAMEESTTGAGLASRMRSRFMTASGLPADAPLAAAFGGPLARTCCPPERSAPTDEEPVQPALVPAAVEASLGVPGPVPSRVAVGIAVGLPYSGSNGAPGTATGVPVGRSPGASPAARSAVREEEVAAPPPPPSGELESSWTPTAGSAGESWEAAAVAEDSPAPPPPPAADGGPERADAEAARLRALKAARSMLARRT